MNFFTNHTEFNSKKKNEFSLITPVRAGFPSPADEYIERVLNPLELLIPNPDSSFLGRVLGDSMKDVFVRNGDLIVVDKSEEALNGSVVVCTLDGSFLTKILRIEGRKRMLVSANQQFPPIPITNENEFLLWGVVSWSCHNLLRGRGVRPR
ncbi:LexA family protein [Leptospira sanjuanensis]|uniref:LexA family protein n=1 Tax=Leptospira sanjuanensis TaxID=2879643 RepID=UPI0038730D6E